MPEQHLPVARILLAGGAVAVGVATAIAAVLAILASRGLPFGGQAVARPAPLAASQAEASPLAQAPAMLEAAPQPDLARFRLEKAHALDELAWADAAHTLARVPIRVAMAMLVARSESASASASVPATESPAARAKESAR